MSTRSITVVSVVVVIFLNLALATRLQALAVGDIVVQSPGGAPLLAEIPLTLTQQERDKGVVTMLGNREEYRAEGLIRPEVIDLLGAAWHTGARDTVRITSRVPIQIPTFDLVLLVHAGQVTIVKTYRIILPAPPSPPPQAMAHAVTPPSAELQKVPATSPAPPKPKKPVVPVTVPAWLQRLPERYGPVERGMPLYSIAQTLGAPTEALWQTVVLIWQANKAQFAGGNMHGLQSGTYLVLPSTLAEDIATLSKAEAQRMVAEQWESWQERTLGGRQQGPPPQQETVVLTQGVASPRPVDTPLVKAPSPASKKESASPPPVVLPAAKSVPVAGTAEVQAVLQSLEAFLAQRLPQRGEAGQAAAFVSTTELQGALQDLEGRLTQRLEGELQRTATAVPEARLTSQAPAVEKDTMLEQWLPASSMVYVLAAENALLLLLVGSLIWRWYRSRP
jgi:Tfp pilus assembly protein FimV